MENRNPRQFCGKVCGFCGKPATGVDGFPRKAGDFPLDCPQCTEVIHNLLKSAVEKSTGGGEVGNALGKTDGKRRNGCGSAVGTVLDVLDDLVDGRVEDGVCGEAALHHGDIGVDGAVVT